MGDQTGQTRKVPLYRRIAALLSTIARCDMAANRDGQTAEESAHWRDMRTMHAQALVRLCKRYLPSGAGIDCGGKLLAESGPELLLFRSDFHHMDENGNYDGWTEHVVRVRASLEDEIMLSISGRNRNEIKDYLHEVWRDALTAEVGEAE